MKYIPFVVAAGLLLCCHLFLSGRLALVGYACVGVIMAIGFRNTRHLVLQIIFAELIIGLCFWLFAWNKGQLTALSNNFHLSGLLLGVVSIVVNLLTVSLLAGTCIVITRRLLPVSSGSKAIAHPVKRMKTQRTTQQQTVPDHL